MESILIGKNRLNLNFEEQTSPNGRPIRLSGISLVTTKPAIWVEGQGYRHSTIYTFRYLDTDAFIGFEFNPQGKFVQKV